MKTKRTFNPTIITPKSDTSAPKPIPTYVPTPNSSLDAVESDGKDSTEAIKKELNDIEVRIDTKEINLSDGKKYLGKKTTYDLNDEDIKKINLDDGIVVKLIANNKGVFVDFRRYYKGYPTKKGVRVLASKFREVADILSEDIEKYGIK